MSKENKNHIIIERFSAEEKDAIKRAVTKARVRRPVFYHDAIVVFATLINRIKDDDLKPTPYGDGNPKTAGKTAEN